MTALTGRTTFRFVNFIFGDSGNVLRTVPIDTLSAVGVTYEEMELQAWMDAVKGRLPTWPDAVIEFGGPLDTTAAASVGSLTGSHILAPMNGVMVPRTLDIQFGIQAVWESGAPQFGISRSATSGYIITKYDVDAATMHYAARAVLFPGSSLPAWGTTAEV